ncbi:MAG TPA: transcriptional regulator [Candidatus Andersenbacteria bacterium]|nr:transcriptional regulator [Candidatus Andersenbacteria bacterium]
MDGTVFLSRGGLVMLVLSRKIGEEIVIDEEVVVRVLKISGSRVQLGFIAPPEIHIRRPEVPPRREKRDLSPTPAP